MLCAMFVVHEWAVGAAGPWKASESSPQPYPAAPLSPAGDQRGQGLMWEQPSKLSGRVAEQAGTKGLASLPAWRGPACVRQTLPCGQTEGRTSCLQARHSSTETSRRTMGGSFCHLWGQEGGSGTGPSHLLMGQTDVAGERAQAWEDRLPWGPFSGPGSLQAPALGAWGRTSGQSPVGVGVHADPGKALRRPWSGDAPAAGPGVADSSLRLVVLGITSLCCPLGTHRETLCSWKNNPRSL